MQQQGNRVGSPALPLRQSSVHAATEEALGTVSPSSDHSPTSEGSILAPIWRDPDEYFDSIVARMAVRYNSLGCALISFSHDGTPRVLACSGSLPRPALEETNSSGIGGNRVFHHRVQRRAPIIIENLAMVERFSGDPLVAGEPGLRFYAGAPVLGSDGKVVAMLSIYDDKPKQHFKLQKCGPLKRAAARASRVLTEQGSL